jgi:hypothetical protein
VPIELHPIQTECCHRGGEAPQSVTLRAYEVYRHVYGAQEKLITGDCRGGFGVGELIAFLYAHSFPEAEWRARVDEALAGMNLGRRGR